MIRLRTISAAAVIFGAAALPQQAQAMNNKDIAEEMAKKAGISKAQAIKALEAALETISIGIKEQRKVMLSDFGLFTVTTKGGRTGRDPKTGKTITIGGTHIIKFKAASKLDDLMSK